MGEQEPQEIENEPDMRNKENMTMIVLTIVFIAIMAYIFFV